MHEARRRRLPEKPADCRVLLTKVRQALAAGVAGRAAAAEAEAARRCLADLSDRERKLLGLIVRGLSNKQVAARLGISVKTVANHHNHLMLKTRAANAADLVRISMTAGAR